LTNIKARRVHSFIIAGNFRRLLCFSVTYYVTGHRAVSLRYPWPQ